MKSLSLQNIIFTNDVIFDHVRIIYKVNLVIFKFIDFKQWKADIEHVYFCWRIGYRKAEQKKKTFKLIIMISLVSFCFEFTCNKLNINC